MKLEGQLYNIEHYDSESRIADIRLLADSIIYKAHFPEKPITPGVCVIQMVGEVMEKFLAKKLLLDEVVNVKFLNVIDPTEHDLVTMVVRKLDESTDENGTLRVRTSVEVYSCETQFVKLSLRYICVQ